MSMPMWHPLAARTPVPRRSPTAFFVGLCSGALFSGLAVYGAFGGASTTSAAQPVDPAPPALAPAATFCQWAAEPGRKVVVFGDNVEAWKVDLRGWSPITVDVPNRTGRQWVKVTVPRGFAEDDVQTVSCKVDGSWRIAEPS